MKASVSLLQRTMAENTYELLYFKYPGLGDISRLLLESVGATHTNVFVDGEVCGGLALLTWLSSRCSPSRPSSMSSASARCPG